MRSMAHMIGHGTITESVNDILLGLYQERYKEYKVIQAKIIKVKVNKGFDEANFFLTTETAPRSR